MGRRRRRTGSDWSSKAGGGPSIPTVPLVIVIGVAVVAGLVAYLVWQQGQGGGDGPGDYARIEGDMPTDKPGEHVDLQGIYDGFYGNRNGNNTEPHVTGKVDFSEQGLPPAGGPMWGGGCGRDAESSPAVCGPAPWGIFRTPWRPETLNHNMEAGGTVIWYNTTDQDVVGDLEDFVGDNSDKLLVLAPYPEMEEERIAITVWAHRDKFPVSVYSRSRLEDFMDAFYCKFDPEGNC